MPEETEINSVFNAVFHPWIKPRSACMYLFHTINCSVLWLISYSGRETIDLRKTVQSFRSFKRSGHVICLFIKSGSQSPREKARWSHGKKRICTLEKYFKLSKPKEKKNKMCRIMLCWVTAPLLTARLARLDQTYKTVLQPRTHYRNTWVHFSTSRVSVVLWQKHQALSNWACFLSDFQCKFLGK